MLISEIMCEAGEEFIEIYNPTDTNFSGNISLEITKSSQKAYLIENITIPSKSYFVIGAEDVGVGYVDYQIVSLVTDIANTGALLVLKDSGGFCIDRLFYCNDSNYGWFIPARGSVVYTGEAVVENDFGKHWTSSVSSYTSSQQEVKGTPGRGGL
ncbi:MAG: lamin tail domain-containing protein [Proteobacteria bacterium]|nr:lamin tail domain-containing protein [Pseudomonadota bacterium]